MQLILNIRNPKGDCIQGSLELLFHTVQIHSPCLDRLIIIIKKKSLLILINKIRNIRKEKKMDIKKYVKPFNAWSLTGIETHFLIFYWCQVKNWISKCSFNAVNRVQGQKVIQVKGLSLGWIWMSCITRQRMSWTWTRDKIHFGLNNVN